MWLPENNSMISRFLFHLVFLSVFLFGSIFSCTAYFHSGTNVSIVKYEIEDELPFDHCCPNDGHKQKIEGKTSEQVIQKQDFLNNDNDRNYISLVFTDEYEIYRNVFEYNFPRRDKQSFFFTDTIRFLI